MARATGRISVVGTMCILGALICWGSVPLFLKHFTAYIDGWTANGLRYPLAMLVWLPWLVAMVRRGERPVRFYVRALVPAVVNLGGQCLWAWAPYFIDPGLLAFVIRLNVIWAIIGALLLFPEERGVLGSRAFWGGLALGVGGFSVIGYYGGALAGGTTGLGIVITVACSVLWGLYGVTVRWSMRGVDSREAFALIGGYTALGTMALMVGLGEPGRALAMPPASMGLLLLSAVVGVSAAHVLYYMAIARMGVSICSGASLLSPFLTAWASWWLYGEQLKEQQWLGGVALVVGAAGVLWAQQHVARAPIDRIESDEATEDAKATEASR